MPLAHDDFPELGATYIETPHAKSGGKSSCVDVVSSGGTIIYGDSPGAHSGGKSSVVDVLKNNAYEDYPAAYSGGRSQEGFPSNAIYYDACESRGAGRGANLDVHGMFEDNASIGQSIPVVSEVFVPVIDGNIVYEFPADAAGGRSAAAVQAIHLNPVFSKSATRSTAGDVAVFVMANSSRSACRSAAVVHAVLTISAVAKSGGASSVASKVIARQAVSSRSGGKSSALLAPVAYMEAVHTKSGGKSSAGEAHPVYIAVCSARAGSRSASGDKAVYSALVSSKAGGKSSCASRWIVREAPSARSGSKTGVSNVRTFNDHPSVRSAGKSASGESAPRYIESPRSVSGMYFHAPGEHHVVGIIPSVRRVLAQYMPSVLSFPEGSGVWRLLVDQQPPYMVIAVTQPSPYEGGAVNDVGQEISVDLILVTARVGAGTDESQSARLSMKPAIDAMLANWDLYGNATDVRLQALPLDRQSQYQSHFDEWNQPVVASYASFMVRVIRPVGDLVI